MNCTHHLSLHKNQSHSHLAPFEEKQRGAPLHFPFQKTSATISVLLRNSPQVPRYRSELLRNSLPATDSLAPETYSQKGHLLGNDRYGTFPNKQIQYPHISIFKCIFCFHIADAAHSQQQLHSYKPPTSDTSELLSG